MSAPIRHYFSHTYGGGCPDAPGDDPTAVGAFVTCDACTRDAAINIARQTGQTFDAAMRQLDFHRAQWAHLARARKMSTATTAT